MENSIVTIDQVSKEIKNAISKLGTPILLKRYQAGDFEGERLIAAQFYLEKREALPQQQATTQAVFGKHRSEMTEQEIATAEAKINTVKAKNKVQPVLTDTQEVIVKNIKKGAKIIANVAIEIDKPSLGDKLTKAEKKIEKIVEQQKAPTQPIMKLTQQEFKLFEIIKVQCEGDNWTQPFNNPFESLREFKGVLGSLKKKNILSYSNDTLHFTLTNVGIQMIKDQLIYKQKNKHEQNFFKKARKTIVIDGKELEKSAYVRMLLRKNNNTSCSELNETLAKVGFSKLYHSELQRCKAQLGIVTDKNKD